MQTGVLAHEQTAARSVVRVVGTSIHKREAYDADIGYAVGNAKVPEKGIRSQNENFNLLLSICTRVYVEPSFYAQAFCGSTDLDWCWQSIIVAESPAIAAARVIPGTDTQKRSARRRAGPQRLR